MLDSFTAARNPSNEPVRNLHCLLPRAIQTIPMAWIPESLFSPSKEHQSLVFDFIRRIMRASPVFDVAIGAWWNTEPWLKKVLDSLKAPSNPSKRKCKKPSVFFVCFDRSRSQCDLNHSQSLESNSVIFLLRYLTMFLLVVLCYYALCPLEASAPARFPLV